MYKITDKKIKKAKHKLAKMNKSQKWKLVEKGFGMWTKPFVNIIAYDGTVDWTGFSLTDGSN